MAKKDRTLVCKSHIYNIFNPIYESWDKITPDINPKYNPIFEVGDKITPDIDPKCS